MHHERKHFSVGDRVSVEWVSYPCEGEVVGFRDGTDAYPMVAADWSGLEKDLRFHVQDFEGQEVVAFAKDRLTLIQEQPCPKCERQFPASQFEADYICEECRYGA